MPCRPAERGAAIADRQEGAKELRVLQTSSSCYEMSEGSRASSAGVKLTLLQCRFENYLQVFAGSAILWSLSSR